MPSESLFIKCKFCGRQTSVSASLCSHCGKRIKKLTLVHWLGIIFVSLIVIGNLIPHKNTAPVKPVFVPAKDIKKQVSDSLKLEYSWKRGGLGLIMEVDLKIYNNSSTSIKDVAIQCDHYAKSGTKIDSNVREIYEV
ncbi:MAG: hypothetical protein K2W88_05075, partial [Pararheinheimera sp.]|nr:hypothetical protein [Rheinheimera sp.]